MKRLEIAFRRFLIRLLGLFGRSRRPLSSAIDYNGCKFLFVRQDRIGDVLISTPLFEVLKKKYPQAVLDVLLSSNNHFVLANDPIIRKRWVYDKGILSSWRLLRAVRKERYDFVIDLMDNPSATSTLICLFARARWTVGLEKDNAYVYDIVVPLLSRKDSHIVDRIARLLTPFGIDPSRSKLHVRYTISDDASQFGRHVFERSGIKSRKAIGINISAGHEVRFWGIENFRILIGLLRIKYPTDAIVVLSKPAHRSYAEQIADGFESVYIPPPTHSFDEFAALVSRLGLLITPDTSAVHLAAAFGIPSVVMYVQSDKDLRIWDPYKSPSEVLIADVDNLRVISPSDVFQAAQRLKNRHRTGSRRTSLRRKVHS